MVNDRDLDLRRMAEDAAEKASDLTARRIGQLLGVDLNDQKQVNEFRSDLVWARGVRRLSERVSGGIVMAMVTLVVGGVAIALWEGIKGVVQK